eukprot:CAMPEP_0117535600 /NCGR_PEP_ID=MMETSP0784-20121206/41018_1 /TAXON_ID=39447 /ORGANISM="" /LENGTH=246 /DNA_ID=CAMNT_0005332131 /DNA_START=21 /DNA_END=761 /DNA_ORIENTATION=-
MTKGSAAMSPSLSRGANTQLIMLELLAIMNTPKADYFTVAADLADVGSAFDHSVSAWLRRERNGHRRSLPSDMNITSKEERLRETVARENKTRHCIENATNQKITVGILEDFSVAIDTKAKKTAQSLFRCINKTVEKTAADELMSLYVKKCLCPTVRKVLKANKTYCVQMELGPDHTCYVAGRSNMTGVEKKGEEDFNRALHVCAGGVCGMHAKEAAAGTGFAIGREVRRGVLLYASFAAWTWTRS